MNNSLNIFKMSKEFDKAPKLLVSGKLNAICEASGQEFTLVYADKVEYDKNGENPIVYYKTAPTETKNPTVSGLIAV